MGQLIYDIMKNAITIWPAVILAVVIGVAGLKYGADWLVGGASNLGFRFGMSAVMVGLTLVAFGTSSPELVVSVIAASSGQPGITLGNVVGSNIANTTLILGITAIIFPLKIKPVSIKFDGPISFLAIGLAFVLALIGFQLTRLDGLILLAVFAIWMIWLIRKSLSEPELGDQHQGIEEEVQFHERSLAVDLGLMAVGLLALVFGADLLVAGAADTARTLNVPEVVVGLTVVAGGTSLPELAVCVVAALRKHGDITVGNVLGSNIFNALLILGTVLVMAPISFAIDGFSWHGDAGTLFVDFPFCFLVCGLIIPLMMQKNHLGRWKGIVLVALYVIYVTTLIFRELV